MEMRAATGGQGHRSADLRGIDIPLRRMQLPRRLSRLLADGLFNAGLVIGPRVEFPDGAASHDLRAEFTTGPTSAGETPVSREGRHPDGNVLSSIVWLANFLRERGLGLQAGQAVIAGSYAGALELPLGEQLHIGFGALGTLLIRYFFSNRSA